MEELEVGVSNVDGKKINSIVNTVFDRETIQEFLQKISNIQQEGHDNKIENIREQLSVLLADTIRNTNIDIDVTAESISRYIARLGVDDDKIILSDMAQDMFDRETKAVKYFIEHFTENPEEALKKILGDDAGNEKYQKALELVHAFRDDITQREEIEKIREQGKTIDEDVLSLLNNLTENINNVEKPTVTRPPARKSAPVRQSEKWSMDLLRYYLYMSMVFMGLLGLGFSNKYVSLGVMMVTLCSAVAPGYKENPQLHTAILSGIATLSLAMLLTF